MADGTIKIDVELNGSPAANQAQIEGQKIGQKVSQGVSSGMSGVKKSTNQALNDIGSQLTAYGAKYTKAVTLPIAAAAVATGASAVKIDTALTGVRKTVDGTEEQYEALKQAAIEFSKTNAVDPAQILDIQALGAQLGYTIDELDMFGEVVSGLDIATNLTAEEAATELAQFANIMGMAHDKTKNYGSTIVELGNNFATTEADISHMAMRIAGAGKQIGLTEADVLGLATALSSMGIEAEAGGTAISTIMSTIDKEVATNGKNLETWAQTAGMSANEFKRAWGEDAVSALSAVLIGMDNATQSGGNMSVILDELGISAIRQTDTLKRLASNSEFLGRAVDTANDAWAENVALDKEVENRNNSMAAKLEILKNKVQAAAVEVGEPFMNALLDVIDAAEPLIQALASGAKAFGDLDEGAQKTVITAIGIAAAFGPVTSIFGKVLSGVGKTSAAWREFNSNISTVRTNLTQSTEAITKQAAAQTKYKTIMAGGLPTIVKYNEETKKYTTASKANLAATNAQVTGVKALTTANKAGAVAMEVMGKAANALKTAFLNIAPLLAITAAIEAFTLLSGAMEDARDKSEKMKKATEGITGAMGSYDKAFESTKGSMDRASRSASEYSHSLGEIRSAVDDAIAGTAELADNISDSFAEVGTSNAMVQIYAETIDDLTNRYDENGAKAALNAQEQGELIAAVEGINEIMGTSYKVIDSQNGILDTNTNEILKSADAWQKRALMEAQSAAAADIMKRQVENTTALRQAEELLRVTKEKLSQAERNGVQDLTDYRLAVESAQGEVDRLNGVQDSLNDEYKDLSLSIAEINNELDSSTDSLKKYVEGTEGWKKALEKAGVGVDNFIKQLSDIGVSTKDLARVMDEQGEEGIQQFINAYKAGGSELEDWMRKQLGADLKDASRYASTKSGDGFIDGMNESEKKIVNAVNGIVGVSTEEFAKLANGAKLTGEESTAALALALADGTVTVESSADDVRAAVQNKIDEMDGNLPANTVIYQMRKAFDAGKSPVGSSADGVANKAQGSLNKIDGKKPATDAVNGLSGMLSSSWARTIAENAAKVPANAASSPLKNLQNQSGSWGEHLTSNFGAGISGSKAVGIVKSGVEKVLAATRAMHFSVPQEGIWSGAEKGGERSGRHFVENFVTGMLSARSELRDATQELAIDMSDTLMKEFAAINPMAQLQESITKGSAALNMSAMMVGSAPSYTTNNQTLNFNGDYASPDIIAREMRMQQHYGLAGRY